MKTHLITLDLERDIGNFSVTTTADADTFVRATIFANGAEASVDGWTGLLFYGDKSGNVVVEHSASSYNTFTWDLTREKIPPNGTYAIMVMAEKEGRKEVWGRGKLIVRLNESKESFPPEWDKPKPWTLELDAHKTDPAAHPAAIGIQVETHNSDAGAHAALFAAKASPQDVADAIAAIQFPDPPEPTDTLMDVTTRGDEADSVRVLRERETSGVVVTGGGVYMMRPSGHGPLQWNGTAFEGNVGGDNCWLGLGNAATAKPSPALPANPLAPPDHWLLVIKNTAIGPGVYDMLLGPTGDMPSPNDSTTETYNAAWRYASSTDTWVAYNSGSTAMITQNTFAMIEVEPKIEKFYAPVAALVDLIPKADLGEDGKVLPGQLPTQVFWLDHGPQYPPAKHTGGLPPMAPIDVGEVFYDDTAKRVKRLVSVDPSPVLEDLGEPLPGVLYIAKDSGTVTYWNGADLEFLTGNLALTAQRGTYLPELTAGALKTSQTKFPPGEPVPPFPVFNPVATRMDVDIAIKAAIIIVSDEESAEQTSVENPSAIVFFPEGE